jgi:hypothetical protein
MTDGEVLQRVVSLLTHTEELARLLEEDVDRDIDTEPTLISALLGDLVPPVTVPGDASAQEVADVLSQHFGRALERLVSTFAVVFHELAHVHDQGRTDVSSAEVLRDLALRWELHDWE